MRKNLSKTVSQSTVNPLLVIISLIATASSSDQRTTTFPVAISIEIR